MYNTQQREANKRDKEHLCCKVVVCFSGFMSAMFLVGVFRKPELMQLFIRKGVQLVKASGSMQGRKIDPCKPWP